MTEQEQYYTARIAARNSQDAAAFIRLGQLYDKGIGTRENHVLAMYFFKKALALGCEEAKDYILFEYENNNTDLAKAINDAYQENFPSPPIALEDFKELVEKERVKKNYGIISSTLHNHMDDFYPEYSEEKAIDDILNDRDTIDADLYYAISSEDVQIEFNTDIIDRLLQQLYAPVLKDEKVMEQIKAQEELDTHNHDEKELIQAIVNFTGHYGDFCKEYSIPSAEIAPIEDFVTSPYISMSAMSLLRKQILKCLLSTKDIDLMLMDRFLQKRYDDEEMLNICEELEEDVRNTWIFLLVFVEINVNMSYLMRQYQELLQDFKSQRYDKLANLLNDFVDRLTEADITHTLPKFTVDNLPPIEL
jgi:hypothetical protein